jgi:membrane-associated protease RseP (regulator of RpoE activity)
VRYGVDATLPFFIPAPTLIGTLGAFIRIRSPIRSRRALFDIGIAGPIAGFVLAVLVLAVSLMLSHPAAGAVKAQIAFTFPLIFQLMHKVIGAAVPLDSMLLHPTAIAAWVGMFATALNLVPGGQLDGGHIVYAVSPEAHRVIAGLTVVALVIGSWWWGGWLMWAFLLVLSGVRHPQIMAPRAAAGSPGMLARSYHQLLGYGTGPSEAEAWAPLGRARALLALFAVGMLVLTLMGNPLPGHGMREWWQAHHQGGKFHWQSQS